MARRLPINKKEINDIIDGWKDSLTIRQLILKDARALLRDKEEELRMAKKHTNRSYKNVVEAKKQIKRWTSRRSGIQSQIRKYNKEHLAEVFALMEKSAMKKED